LLADTNAKRSLGFQDFFPMSELVNEHDGFDIITTEEFLLREAGQLKDSVGNPAFPPGNRTNWNVSTREVTQQLEPWLRSIAFVPDWDPETCLAAFPASTDPKDAEALQQTWNEMIQENGGPPPHEQFIGKPTSVYAAIKDRMAESSKGRSKICIYSSEMHQQRVIHFGGNQKVGVRLLVHFYGFLFFANWKQDLWTKRFVRDHIHYKDEIQCAAARIVHAVRHRAKTAQNEKGDFDSFHIRRGEFQYKRTRVEASEIYEISKGQIRDGSTVYGASTERVSASRRMPPVNWSRILTSCYSFLKQWQRMNAIRNSSSTWRSIMI
jgi:hypothetical protein